MPARRRSSATWTTRPACSISIRPAMRSPPHSCDPRRSSLRPGLRHGRRAFVREAHGLAVFEDAAQAHGASAGEDAQVPSDRGGIQLLPEQEPRRARRRWCNLHRRRRALVQQRLFQQRAAVQSGLQVLLAGGGVAADFEQRSQGVGSGERGRQTTLLALPSRARYVRRSFARAVPNAPYGNEFPGLRAADRRTGGEDRRAQVRLQRRRSQHRRGDRSPAGQEPRADDQHLFEPEPVADRAARASSAAAVHARLRQLRSSRISRSCTATACMPTITPSSAASRAWTAGR